jgi:GntR family transcriptional regulator, transcriptional repressor for pyruvate dehydrogenase complex
VVASLRAQVIAGAFSATRKLPTEAQLTEAFGVSRTVIREAIAALAADGLVEPRQGAGRLRGRSSDVRVRGDQPGHRPPGLHRAQRARGAPGIEIESAGACRAAPQQRAGGAIQEAFFEFERLLALGEATGKTDFAFHRAIAAATNNPFYVEVLDALGAAPSPATSPRPGGPRAS